MLSLFSKERKQSLLKEIITYFKDERELEMGVIAAEETLDFFMEAIAKDIYNKGVADTKELLEHKWSDLTIDLDLLKK